MKVDLLDYKTDGSDGSIEPKAQSAMEFLTTYGWMILVLAVVIGALYSLGLFNSSGLQPYQCAFRIGLTCGHASISSSGIITIDIVQDSQFPLNITGFACNQDGSYSDLTAPYNPPSNQIYLGVGQNYTISTQCYTKYGTAFSGGVGKLFSGYFVIGYTDQVTGENSITTGKLELTTT